MKFDLFTKIILVIIALNLSITTIKDFGLIPTDFHVANIIDGIYDRTMKCLVEAKEKNMPTNLIAEMMAAERFKHSKTEIST